MATRTKAQAVTPADRHVAITNLGTAVAKLGRTIIGNSDEDEWTTGQDYELGRQLDKALRAAVKAIYPGSQKTAQVTAALDAARKAMNRALARMVAG
jgi:hypothetical protein